MITEKRGGVREKEMQTLLGWSVGQFLGTNIKIPPWITAPRTIKVFR